jgi:glycerol kinase
LALHPGIAAIDQGSTSTKGAVFSLDGETLARAEVGVARYAHGVRVMHEPEAVLAGVRAVLGELRREGPVALGLACQRSTCLIWERASGKALTPALSWQDRREDDRVRGLAEYGGEIARRTGLRLSPHYAAPKLAGLLEALPSGVERARAGELVAGTLDAWLVGRLTGRDGTEPGHAGRTLLYDLEEGRWDAELCALWGLPESALPALRPSAGPWGEVDGVPLLVSLGDQQAALLGHGGWAEGVVAAHFGTGAFVLAATGERIRRHPGLLSAVLAATEAGRRFQLEGSVNSAGSAVDWACGLTGVALDAWAERPLDPDHLPWVFPALAGAAAPWWRPQAAGVAAGLGLATSGEELVGGVLAGVANRVLDCVEALAEAGLAPQVLRVSGKLARLAGLVGLLADAGQLSVEVAAEEETGLLGAARLAAATAGLPVKIATAPPVRRRREPAWPAARAATLRARWRDFAERALALGGVDSPP